MTIFQAIILGILQGTTEFVPVSSSGHLVLVPWLLGWGSPGLTFGVAVHFGTMFGVLLYFWREWWAMFRAVLRWPKTRGEDDPDRRLFLLLALGTIPAAVIGGIFEGFFTEVFEHPLVAALMLLVTAGLLILGERIGKSTRSLTDMRWRDSLFIGFAQALAIFPGISRSGATIAAGRLRDVRRDDAARFSFLLASPIIFGAGLIRLTEMLQTGMEGSTWFILLAGFLSALISGYLVIHWLLNYLRTRSTTIFAVYCVAASIFSLVVLAIRSA